MGSSGSGKFGTYRIGEGEGANSSKPKEIECPPILENILLEDVAVSEYYKNNSMLPDHGISVKLKSIIFKGRLVIETVDSDEILGNLPTQYNNLVNCIEKGYRYSGTVVASGITPVPFVMVTLSA